MTGEAAAPAGPPGPLDIVRVLAGAGAGAALLGGLQVPAGVLLGSILGAALANRLWPRAEAVAMPQGVRVSGFVLLGAITGVRLQPEVLGLLGRIAVPVLGAVALLLVLNVLLALLLICRYRVDPMTAVLATAPGGLSEIVGMSLDRGARTSLVIAVHSVRLLLIVLGVLPALTVYLAGT